MLLAEGIALDPGLGDGPVGEVQELGLVEDGDGVPGLAVGAEVVLVAVAAELAGQQVVGAVRQQHGLVDVQLVHDLHVVVVAARALHRLHDAVELHLARLHQHQLRRQDLLLGEQPVRPRHGHGARRHEEQLVHGLQDRRVRVYVEHALVLRLVEGEELREGFGPGGCRMFC